MQKSHLMAQRRLEGVSVLLSTTDYPAVSYPELIRNHCCPERLAVVGFVFLTVRKDLESCGCVLMLFSAGGVYDCEGPTTTSVKRLHHDQQTEMVFMRNTILFRCISGFS